MGDEIITGSPFVAIRPWKGYRPYTPGLDLDKEYVEVMYPTGDYGEIVNFFDSER